MNILKVSNPEFCRYGKVITGIDCSDMAEAMEATPLPEDVVYVASEASLRIMLQCGEDYIQPLRGNAHSSGILQWQ